MNTEKWYKNFIEKVEKTPEYHAEGSLLELEERICEIGGQPKGLYAILFWLLEWIANILIYRKTPPNTPLHVDRQGRLSGVNDKS